LLGRFKIEKDQVLKVLELLRSENVTQSNSQKKPKLLAKFTRNLTTLAREDKLDPVIGRDNEIMRMMQILSRRTKNNPILIGEAGTGKTSVAEALAIRIAIMMFRKVCATKKSFRLILGFFFPARNTGRV